MCAPPRRELTAGAAAVTSFEASLAEAATIVTAHPTFAEAMGELYLTLSGRPLHHR